MPCPLVPAWRLRCNSDTDAIKYGLDLRGGVYVVLEARPGEGETVAQYWTGLLPP